MKNSPKHPPQPLSTLLLKLTILRVSADKNAAGRFGCMHLPSPIFENFCRRLIDRRTTWAQATIWLSRQVKSCPARSSVYRFAAFFTSEFNLVIRDYARRTRE